MESNDRVGVKVEQPLTKTDRAAVARHCCGLLEITMPVVVDEMDDRVGHAYSGMPDRLYVLDRDGRVAYKGGRGPFGFKPGEMEQALAMLLIDQTAVVRGPTARVSTVSDEEAWKKLPRPEHALTQPLPVWARALAASLPRTTAAMLELDYLQRARSPLDPLLRGKMRWVAAHANRCGYGEAYAAADLRRAGLEQRDIEALGGDWKGLQERERAALQFAHNMTLAADSVTDLEMTRLMELFGDKQVVAMVLLLAYANFQDRLLLTLGLDVEDGGPLPAAEICFPKKSVGLATSRVAHRPGSGDASTSPFQARVNDSEWNARSLSDLQRQMEKQRARPTRIRVPSWEEVKKGLPEWYPVTQPSRVRWTLVCLGYQPELSAAWLRTMRTFAEESKQDRVFEESVFWVITRALQCYY